MTAEGRDRPTVEEVEASQGSACSPVICILGICLCLVLVALVVVTALHTHTKLQSAEDPAASLCLLGPTGLRAPCKLAERSLNFSFEVGAGGDACKAGSNQWFQFACPASSSIQTFKATSSQQVLLLAIAKSACKGGEASVDWATRRFFNVTDVFAELVKPTFSC